MGSYLIDWIMCHYEQSEAISKKNAFISYEIAALRS